MRKQKPKTTPMGREDELLSLGLVTALATLIGTEKKITLVARKTNPLAWALRTALDIAENRFQVNWNTQTLH